MNFEVERVDFVYSDKCDLLVASAKESLHKNGGAGLKVASYDH